MAVLAGSRDPAVVKKLAGDWLDRQARLEMAGSVMQDYVTALAEARRKSSEVDRAYQTGVLTQESMRKIWPQWSKH